MEIYVPYSYTIFIGLLITCCSYKYNQTQNWIIVGLCLLFGGIFGGIFKFILLSKIITFLALVIIVDRFGYFNQITLFIWMLTYRVLHVPH
jgi:hypothetical protein